MFLEGKGLPRRRASDVRWTHVAGTGVIYSFSVTRPAGAIAYCIAFVTLDDGPTMMTNIVDCDLDAVRIGQRVRVVIKRTQGGIAVPMFTPAGGPAWGLA